VPITFITPPSGNDFGPGYVLRLTSDFVGPLPTGSTWQIFLQPGGGIEDRYGGWTYPAPTAAGLACVLGIGTINGEALTSVDSRFGQGATVDLEVRLVDNTSSTVDSGTIPVKLDFQTGAPAVLQQQTQASGGLTTEQSAQLQVTTEAMGFAIGGGLLEGVTDLLGLVGKRLFNDVLIEPDRSGEGSLTRPGPLGGVNAFGIQWQLVSVPSGFGIDEGAPDQTEIDFMQLSYMYDSDVGLVPSDSKYIRSLNGRWNWGLSYPDAVNYFIMPGATVRFWWIILAPFSSSEVSAGIPIPH